MAKKINFLAVWAACKSTSSIYLQRQWTTANFKQIKRKVLHPQPSRRHSPEVMALLKWQPPTADSSSL